MNEAERNSHSSDRRVSHDEVAEAENQTEEKTE